MTKVFDPVASAVPIGSDVIGATSMPVFGSGLDDDADVVKGRDGTSRSSTSDHKSEGGELAVALAPDSKHSYNLR